MISITQEIQDLAELSRVADECLLLEAKRADLRRQLAAVDEDLIDRKMDRARLIGRVYLSGLCSRQKIADICRMSRQWVDFVLKKHGIKNPASGD